MFLCPDEYLLVMNLPEHQKAPGQCIPLPDDELRRLRDVGVQTVINYSHWNVTDSQEGWGYVDALVKQARRLGLKCILATPNWYPLNLPDAWFARLRQGRRIREVLSIWNRDAMSALTRHLEEVIRRYGGPGVLVTYAGYLGGECVLHNAPCFYDEAALASCGGEPDIETEETQEWLKQSVVEHFMEVDGVLVTQHNSVWNALQWLIAQQSKANGNFAQEDILRAEFETWPEAERVLLQYTYYAHREPYPTLVKQWKQEFGLSVIVEAQYCVGLETTTPLAIEWGFRGQIVCPLHPWAGVKSVGQEQVDQVARSHRLWESGDVS